MKTKNPKNPSVNEFSLVTELALRAKVALLYGQTTDALEELRCLLLTERLEAQAGRCARSANAWDDPRKKTKLKIADQRAEQVGRDAWVDLVAKLEVFLESWDYTRAADITEYLMGSVVSDWKFGLRGYLKSLLEGGLDIGDHVKIGADGAVIDTIDSRPDSHPSPDSLEHPFWRTR
jgi:hypothetical protein